MANIIMIEGASGSGKSFAMNTLLQEQFKEQTGVFNVASKRLPFRNDLKVANHADYTTIFKCWQRSEQSGAWKLIYVIDDSQYLMAFDAFGRAKETGYQKYSDMAVNFYNLIRYAIEKIPDDVNVYFLHHTEMTDDGHIKAKTLGKMIDNQLTLEGLFSIVLLAQTDGKRHWFTTQSDGYTTAKSPMGMFPLEIENDLAAVDTAIRDYYGMKPIITTTEQENKGND